MPWHSSDSSWLAHEESEWNSLLSPSASVPGEPKAFGLPAGLLHSLCRLGQRRGKMNVYSHHHFTNALTGKSRRWSVRLPPTDHHGVGTLWAGGEDCAVGWDNSLLAAAGRYGNHPALWSLKVVGSTLRLHIRANMCKGPMLFAWSDFRVYGKTASALKGAPLWHITSFITLILVVKFQQETMVLGQNAKKKSCRDLRKQVPLAFSLKTLFCGDHLDSWQTVGQNLNGLLQQSNTKISPSGKA